MFCREGLIQLEYMQREIMEGKGKNEFLELTDEIGAAMCFSTSCSVGQTSAKLCLAQQNNLKRNMRHILGKNMSCRGMHRFRKYLY